MSAVDLLINYISRSSFITIFVLIWLSFYFITTFGVLISRYFYLNSWLKIERNSLESMLMGAKNVRDDSVLRKCTSRFSTSENLLNVCKSVAEKNSTNTLWMLSMIASTSPFIGLFGTVVGILESFAKFSTHSKVSFSIIAPAISEALVATAAGIFVAIFAYTFHQIITRKVYEFNAYLKSQSEILLSRN